MVVRANKSPVIAMLLQCFVIKCFDVGDIPKAGFLQDVLDVAVDVCHIKKNGC
jgi:hypothetical protein